MKINDKKNNFSSISALLKDCGNIETRRVRSTENKYIHSLTGNIGNFVEKRNGYYGEILIIRLDDGREYFAPTHEFRRTQ